VHVGCKLTFGKRTELTEVHSFHPILGDFNQPPSRHDLKILTRDKKQKDPLTLTLRDA